jgi:hypothetical protein
MGDPILVKMSAHLPESSETLKYAVLRRNKTIPTGFREFPFFAHFAVPWLRKTWRHTFKKIWRRNDAFYLNFVYKACSSVKVKYLLS